MKTGSYGLGATLLAMTLAASFGCIDAASAQASTTHVKAAPQDKAAVAQPDGASSTRVASTESGTPAVDVVPPARPATTERKVRKSRKHLSRRHVRHRPLDLSSGAVRGPVVSSFAPPSTTKPAAPATDADAQRADLTTGSIPRTSGTDYGSGAGRIRALIASHAAANGVPVELAAAVVRVESRFNPRARNGANVGLTQISTSTARAMGYRGSAAGLYDADTNLRYGIRYLAEAYRLAGGDTCRTVLKYQAGHRAVSMTGAARAYCAKVRPQVVGRR
jgi:soluble lytic murein transglycosylase-like protein